MTDIKNKLTDLCGNGLLPNDCINVFCEKRSDGALLHTVGEQGLGNAGLIIWYANNAGYYPPSHHSGDKSHIPIT